MSRCPFCWPIQGEEVLFENETCIYIKSPDEILIGSGMIVPKKHRETVFDLANDEIQDTFILLKKVKEYMDNEFKPDGYNVGWRVTYVPLSRCKAR